MKLKINFLGTYTPTNIGNFFIDLGSQHIFKQIDENIDMKYLSGFPRLLFEKSTNQSKLIKWSEKLYNLTLNKILKKSWNKEIKDYVRVRTENITMKNIHYENFFDLSKYIKTDYIVFSGCILTKSELSRFGKTLMELKNNGIKIIFNGVGGAYYSDSEISLVSKFLENLEPYALITRDEIAYRNYGEYSKFSYSGIDCAFFISDFYKPSKINLDYVVYNFDKNPEPFIEQEKTIIRLHHSYFPEISKNFLEKPNTLISDNPYEYLDIYSNAKMVYSDRVHACVPSISFSVPCQFYYETPRALLFERVGINLDDKPLNPDKQKIKIEKEKHIKFLSDIINI